MDVKLLVEKTLMPGIPSAKAYQLAFTDDAVYFLFLGRDWGGFRRAGAGAAAAGGFLQGAATAALSAAVQSTAGAISHNKIAQKLADIKDANLGKIVANDPKCSFKTRYADIKQFKHRKKSWWSGEAFVWFKTDAGKFKFCLTDEAQREKIAEIICKKRPDLVA